MTLKPDWVGANATLGLVVTESAVMDVYNAMSTITDPGVPPYLKL